MKYTVKTYHTSDHSEREHLVTTLKSVAVLKLNAIAKNLANTVIGAGGDVTVYHDPEDDRIEVRGKTWSTAVYILETPEPQLYSRIRYEFIDQYGFARVWAEGDPGQEDLVIDIANDRLQSFVDEHECYSGTYLFTGAWVSQGGTLVSGVYDIDLPGENAHM